MKFFALLLIAAAALTVPGCKHLNCKKHVEAPAEEVVVHHEEAPMHEEMHVEAPVEHVAPEHEVK